MTTRAPPNDSTGHDDADDRPARDGRPARELDAREIDGPPFGTIASALSDLGDGETLVLYNGFDPEPLYAVLDRRGFDHETERVGPDEWRVEITRR
ncbi:DUF2249 domain-containing protein [Halorussus caseinilyticus]|uniref:DUF2249 domain-containing protein n=1 Tax=Halorussus caseinilyticus TaxID=3034025 RepID=A0ABD5WNV2_9EURY|nr:DUF2249 domain-containing protein [Halorussus sp. DT72]